MLNSLDPNQAQHFVEPDLDPNCLKRLSADSTSRQRVNVGVSSKMALLIIEEKAKMLTISDN